MGSKLTVAAYYKLSHLSEKITHQVKRKYIFEKKKKVHLSFWSVGEIENVYAAKKQDCL